LNIAETKLRGITAEALLERLSDLENYPDDVLSPYQEFEPALTSLGVE
jgi:hypothetical protein